MRVQLSRQALSLLYSLRENAAALRTAISLIRRHPNQPDAIDSPGRPGRKELHVRVEMRGFWIGYEIDRSGGETTILIVSIEEI